MSPIEAAGIVVALIAALGSWASARAANQASIVNTRTNAEVEKEKSRTDLETDAYNRARAFDVATIARLELENTELRTEREQLKASVKKLERRVAVLEREHNHCNIPEDEDDTHQI